MPIRMAIDNHTYVRDLKHALLMASLKHDAVRTLDVREWQTWGLEV